MAGFGFVDQAVKSINTVEEYIKVGMDIANEVALDFLESNKDQSEKDVIEFRKVMLNFVKMEQEIKHLQEAVDYVKQQPQDSGVKLESVLDKKLEELKSGTSDTMLLQHDKIQEFNQRMWDTLHPDEAYAAAEFGFPAPGSDMDVEMTQEKVNTRCPYTGMEMVYPVRNKHCGHNYDKDGIQQYIKQRKKKAKCPLGGCSNEKPIEMSDLEENKELKRYIERMNRNVKKGKK
ncbi:E3 SUMO-protein ligase NSE2-like isoform X2 [Mercenaria mercenaria]|uniref:E3 SUMO-protein ligase NSE2-like isoform X2 n=1 Tax=Mercenaria mercenaria TaxID=6596 RepID=UPI001E1E1AA9|nr:E3 SUMO-protein ligase NSE2-like isoform X2 [Mercenaria mercenaria]